MRTWRILLVLSLMLVFVVPHAEAAPVLIVTFLDVGQGDSIWIVTPDGQDILVDGGPTSAGPSVVSYLTSHGCTGVEYMLLTHPHADHIGGLNTVLTAMPVDHVWYNGQSYSSATYTKWLGLTEGKRTTVHAGETYTVGPVTVRIVHADAGDPNANNNSVAAVLTYGSFDVVLTGDMESDAEGQVLASGVSVTADVLKVGHHGSATSTSAPFLAAVSPQTAVISVGAGNSYGHPALTTLSRLTNAGITTYRTDCQGTVTITSNGTFWIVRTGRKAGAMPMLMLSMIWTGE